MNLQNLMQDSKNVTVHRLVNNSVSYTHLARFLGMVNYFHKYIPHLAEIAAPLNSSRKKGTKFEWSSRHQNAFEQLKESIISPPVLQLADFTKPFVVQTDSSSVALGAVIYQEIENSRLPISYASRTLSDQERKYSAYELECLAIVFALSLIHI